MHSWSYILKEQNSLLIRELKCPLSILNAEKSACRRCQIIKQKVSMETRKRINGGQGPGLLISHTRAVRRTDKKMGE